MKTIPNLGLNITDGLLLVGCISFCVTLFSYHNVNTIKSDVFIKIKKQEDKLSTFDFFLLYVNRIIHLFNLFFTTTILFIFKPNIFLYIICVIIYTGVFLNLHILQNECPISYLEKKILQKTYIFNSNPKYEPYRILSFIQNQNIIEYSLLIFNSTFVLFRLFQHYYLPKSQIPVEVRL